MTFEQTRQFVLKRLRTATFMDNIRCQTEGWAWVEECRRRRHEAQCAEFLLRYGGSDFREGA